jgi:hypothetical protein
MMASLAMTIYQGLPVNLLEPSAGSLDDHGERQHGAQAERDHHRATFGDDVEGGFHRFALRANAAAAQILCISVLRRSCRGALARATAPATSVLR